MRIKEVIFDIDGTLYDFDPGHEAGMKAMAEYAGEELGISEDEFRAAYRQKNEELTARLGNMNAAIHNRSLRLQNMLEAWDKPLFPHVQKLYDLYWDTLLSTSQAEPWALEAIQELKNLGIKVGIGTDMTSMMQYRKLEVYGFAPYVDHMVISEEAGYEKPAREFMDLCIKKAGAEAEACVFVGDNFKKDVLGSAEAGMWPVWYNPKKKALPREAEAMTGKYKELHSYKDLVSYVKSLG